MNLNKSKTFTVDIDWPVHGGQALPPLPDPNSIQFLEIYLSENVNFNSYGIKDWINWLKPFSNKDGICIQLHHCPSTVVYLINIMIDFLPKNGELISFYVPYYSQETDETQNILFKKGHQFLEDKLIEPEVKDSAGNLMEMDIVPSTFFKFLNR